MIDMTADALAAWADKHKDKLTPEQSAVIADGVRWMRTASQKEFKYSEALKADYRDQMVKVLDVLSGFDKP